MEEKYRVKLEIPFLIPDNCWQKFELLEAFIPFSFM